MNPTYLGDIDLNEETLAHFGVKGMKWGKRKAKLKSDLKWKVGKLKGKALEAKAKYKRNKYYGGAGGYKYIKTKNVGNLTKNSKDKSIIDNWLKKDSNGEKWTKGQPTSYSGNVGSNLNRGIEAGRSRKATESYVKSMGNVTGSTRSSSVSVSKPKSSKKQSSYGGGEKWQPRTNAERTAKRNDDFVNSPGGQELVKIYKRKKAMSSRKSTKA